VVLKKLEVLSFVWAKAAHLPVVRMACKSSLKRGKGWIVVNQPLPFGFLHLLPIGRTFHCRDPSKSESRDSIRHITTDSGTIIS
jgi:hypothetical protein